MQSSRLNTLKKQLCLPSPWEKHQTSWSNQAGIELWIKRDDLIHPLISGNKWRKLVGILNTERAYSRICTFGGPYSNHILATAVAANYANIPSIGYVRGEKPTTLSTVLELCSYYGMQLRYLDRQEYRDKKEISGLIDSCLYIPEGGYSEDGIKGVSAIFHESKDRMDYYMLACGTATTLAGLLQANTDNNAKFIGVSALKGGDFLHEAIRSLTQAENYELLTEYHFGGYAKLNDDLLRFIEEFAQETSVLLDPIYTAKCFYAAKELARSAYFKAGTKLGLIHTGGLTGWYGKWPELLGIKKA